MSSEQVSPVLYAGIHNNIVDICQIAENIVPCHQGYDITDTQVRMSGRADNIDKP